MGKIEMLDYYIKKADEIIASNDINDARIFQNEIIAVYENEIKNIREMLDSYSWATSLDNHKVDYIGDVKLLKAKLINYKNNLETGLYKEFLPYKANTLNVTQNSSQNMNNTVQITFEQTISAVEKLSDEILSQTDKEILLGKLTAISNTNDKSTRWEKIRDILKWIANRGIEVGIAALPYIVEVMKG